MFILEADVVWRPVLEGLDASQVRFLRRGASDLLDTLLDDRLGHLGVRLGAKVHPVFAGQFGAESDLLGEAQIQVFRGLKVVLPVAIDLILLVFGENRLWVDRQVLHPLAVDAAVVDLQTRLAGGHLDQIDVVEFLGDLDLPIALDVPRLLLNKVAVLSTLADDDLVREALQSLRREPL